MGVVVDFNNGLEDMLDELEETYDGRILSPQGKIIRVMPIAIRKEEDSRWMFHGHIYVTAIMGEEIYQSLLETVPVLGYPDPDQKWREARDDLKKLTFEVERSISARGFLIRRGRYIFKGEDPHVSE
ncbi:MAG: hypothetical protein C4536_00205 [Actinobacteria bacterium]|jgi:hypothetical protein|nr:MAG: hypothetical protein C4536_00205 [Actinomycetota bacterium]